MDIDERLALVQRNTQEIVTLDELRKLLEEKEHPAVYLGTAITGRPHVAYFLWVLKLADFLKAGLQVKLLLADLHGALDNTPWELLEKRYEYYSTVITGMFKAVGADTKHFEFVKGSSFEKSGEYFFDVLRMATKASIRDATKAGSEVVKQSDNPKVAGLLYPIMQSLDEQYLDVDIQYGGMDQRKIFMFAREFLPKIGYKSRVEIMTPIIPGLIGEKMSASDPNSKIDLLDDAATVKKKLKKAYCPEGIVEGNGVLAFLRHVFFVMKSDAGEEFVIERPEKFGGNVSFASYDELERAFVDKKIHPMDVKNALAKEITKLLDVVQAELKGKEALVAEAYP
ncbi:MAG: tyrosine--tRNA ligase [Candidatus Woesearchaeota archaeon]|nr:tyrosine--tRNA ligase [Candidatus Woesearchaeota archaeon]